MRRCDGFDPFRDSRITSEHYFVLERVGDGIDLEELTTLGNEESIRAVVAELQAWGAVAIDGIDEDGDEDTQISGLSLEEQRMLQEDVDLDEQIRHKLLRVRRSLEEGAGAFELLGVEPRAGRRKLVQAFFELSKRFHPERFRGQRLGSFGPIIGEVFATASQAVKALSDSRTTTSSHLGLKHRRNSRRLAFRARITARCESWDTSEDLTTRDLSVGGLFVCTSRSAKPGERISIDMDTRSGRLSLVGRVSWLRPPSEAERLDVDAGFGVRLDALANDVKTLWQEIVAKVTTLQPTAETTPPEPGQAVLAQGTGRYKREPVIGIDLGTSYTSVAAAINNRVRILPWSNGAISIPSVVAFPAPGRHIVGQDARERLLTDPRHTISSAKRLLGRNHDDREVRHYLGQVPYETTVGPDGFVMTEMWGEPYHMAQVCSYILRAAREAAEQALDCSVGHAVLSVPVSFTPERLELVRRAAQLAQLEVVDIVEEPNAAALANRAYPDFGGLVGIYDFGGGTFDFSIIDASGGDFRVLATTGDSWLGGDDLDLSLAEATADLVWNKRQVELRNRAVEWQALLFSSEQAKRTLSSQDIAQIHLPEYKMTAEGEVDLRINLRRYQAEKLWQGAIDRSLATCTQALHLLGLQPADLSQIYLSGGTTYTPAVREALYHRFGVPIRSLVPPEFAVALGAGVQAATLERGRPMRSI